ncbi:MAG: 2-hydroxymuconic semialdehyde dehydrogenase [SAR324 cluster bacterium]|nr:2-hydroxymuconic semialdehyde dehydrogenase [SAR324 cluster bacterium]
MKEIKHFIGGEYVGSKSGKTFYDINPATGEVIGQVHEGGQFEIDAAVTAAKKVEKVWGTMPQKERSDILIKVAEGIMAHREEFLAAEVEDTGKPVSLANKIDIPRGSANFVQFAEHFKYVATECWEMEGAINYAQRRPLGTIGVISPWNLPLLLMTWKVGPAMAAGNCVIVKPSEETPQTASLLGQVMNDAGVPKGAYNVVQGLGADSAGEFLSSHSGINGLTFTGETTTGKAIMAKAAQNLLPLSFELGGKNPVLIFKDADLDQCVETTMRSSFANQGEVCLCGSRIYVQEEIFDEYVKRLTAKVKSDVVIGDPTDPKTTLGSLVSEGHRQRVMGYIESARKDGATFHTGGKAPTNLPKGFEKGAYLEPTIITGLDETCKAQREEIFGPVVSICPFKTEEEAIALANNSDYGLSATIWTENLKRAHRVAGEVEAGIIWVNEWFLRDLRTPFGGMKNSGIGREGGVYSLEFYTELKNICIKL